MTSNDYDTFDADDELPEEEHVVTDTGAFALIPEWVLDHPDLEAQDIRLYCVLNRYADRLSRAWPSRATLGERLRCSPSTVDRCMSRLVVAGAVEVQKRFRDGAQISNLYRLIRARKVAELGTPPPLTSSPPQLHACSPPSPTDGEQNESHWNESHRNEKKKTSSSSRGVLSSGSLSGLLAELMVANGCKPPVVTNTWLTEERLLLTKDGRDRAEAERVLRWCQADPFWKGNVLSFPTFRAKYDQLRLAMDRPDTRLPDRTHRNPANTLHDREGGDRVIQQPKSMEAM